MKIELRDYQRKLVETINRKWGIHRVILAILATGGGKTFCFSYIVREHTGGAGIIVHRREIIEQISLSLGKLGVKHRIVAPPETVSQIRMAHLKKLKKSFIDQQNTVGVASVQTLNSKSSKNNRALQAWIGQTTLCVFDEGHHYVKKGQWGEAVEMFDHAKILMVTATPERADGIGLGIECHGGNGFAECMIESKQTGELIREGSLCRFRYVAPESNLNVDGLPLNKNGDLNTKAMRARVLDSCIVGDTVAVYQKHALGKRAIVFATDVATANEMARAFSCAGIPAIALDGKTDALTRREAGEEFETGELLVLINVDLFDEGYDVPVCECAILARPTYSLAKYLQQCGRVLRIAVGKQEALIIDQVRNWERNGGTPNIARKWSLAGREKGSKGASSDCIPERLCLGCGSPYPITKKCCPWCGAVPQIEDRSEPGFVDGDLFELDLEAMEALLNKQAKAQLSDEEYALEQIARGLHPMARAADARRYRAARYRRGVLNNFIAFWVGMQKDRDMSEIHRRFHFRFGVDIGNALTLTLKETDALIETIKNNFSKDIEL